MTPALEDDDAPPELPDTLTLSLRKPVELDGVTYAELQLHEPNAGEVREISRKAGPAGAIAAVALVAGVPAKAIAKIGVRDLKAATTFIEALLEAPPARTWEPEDPPDDYRLPLRKSVEFAGMTFDALQLREPTAGELERFAQKRGVDATIFAVFLLSGVPIGAVEKITARDLRLVEAYFEDFS